MDSENTNHTEDSIDLVELLGKLWKNRKTIVLSTSVAIFLGLMVAIFSPVKYTAYTVFVPQASEDQPSGGISSLASLAGIRLGSLSQGQEINPMLYPNIAYNVPFKLNLLEQTIVNQNGEAALVSAHLLNNKGFNLVGTLKKYTIGWVRSLFSKPPQAYDTGSDAQTLISLSEEEFKLLQLLENKYTVTINEKDGNVLIEVVDKDPVLAAGFVERVTSNLQAEIIQKRLEKVKTTLEFTEKQYTEKREEFEQLQDELARFKDRNKNINNSLFQNELDRLQAQYSIALNVVTELATQVEGAKLQVNKDTPIFTVIEPVTVPTEKSEPKRLITLIIWTFLGLVLSAGWVLVKDTVFQIKEEVTKA